MYTSYFGLKQKPFTIAPNPQYLFMSKQHQEALAHMLYGLQGEGGVMVLTGEVGTGKTTICRQMLAQVPENTDIAYIINPKQSEAEMLASLCDELHITCENTTSIKALTDALNQFLLDNHAQGRHTILIIDEAQNLDTSVLEQLRLLTNLETNDKKLLQIMLLGQPELSEMLQRQDLRQLAQRITARYHLMPLDKEEVAAYVNHRLSIAGCENQNIFPASVLQQLFQYTGGVPRLINLIADRALLGAYASEQTKVNKHILHQARDEVLGATQIQTEHRSPLKLILLLVLIVGIGIGLWQMPLPTKAVVMQSSPSKVVNITPKPTLEVDEPETLAVTPEPTVLAPKPEPAIMEQPTLPTTIYKNMAFVPIFQAWGVDFNPQTDGEACDFAQTNGLLCLRQKDGIAAMRSLNRPAVLTVADEHGQTAYTALLILGGTTTQVATKDEPTEISLQQLALQSFNDFTLLWKTPTGYTAPVRPGHSGALVAHLAEQVTKALNQSWIGAPRTKYDNTLKEQVKVFQRQQGLNPDGVAGPITWIHLNQSNHIDAPSLNTANP
ncbi:MAG: hypothetical protein COB79_00205 [Zetaproteobacteria bacterium]|nr:MAG: hypothetical protein COB79_00205 [Zetaproteobacteria bacterium]